MNGERLSSSAQHGRFSLGVLALLFLNIVIIDDMPWVRVWTILAQMMSH